MQVLAACPERYTAQFNTVMRNKLGLQVAKDGDNDLITQLQACMQQSGADFTLTFRSLACVDVDTSPGDSEGSGDGGVQAFLDAVLPTCPDPSEMAATMRSKIDPRQLTLLQKLASEQPAMLARLGLSCEVWAARFSLIRCMHACMQLCGPQLRTRSTMFHVFCGRVLLQTFTAHQNCMHGKENRWYVT